MRRAWTSARSDRLHVFGVWINLRHATDTLEASYQLAITTATELMAYCRRLGIPFGINVESVSIRREEIEASVRLAQQLRTQIRG